MHAPAHAVRPVRAAVRGSDDHRTRAGAPRPRDDGARRLGCDHERGVDQAALDRGNSGLKRGDPGERVRGERDDPRVVPQAERLPHDLGQRALDLRAVTDRDEQPSDRGGIAGPHRQRALRRLDRHRHRVLIRPADAPLPAADRHRVRREVDIAGDDRSATESPPLVGL